MATLSLEPLSNDLQGTDLHQMLADVRQYFFSRGESLPSEFLPKSSTYVNFFAPVFMDGDPAPPPAPDQHNALRLIHEMASPLGRVAMLDARDRGLIDLDAAADFAAPLELAIQFWLKDRRLFKQLYAELSRRFLNESICDDGNVGGIPVSTRSADVAPVSKLAVKVETCEKTTIERRVSAGKVHWIVGGVDKGVLYTRSNSKRAFILDTLYEGIGRGWIPHALFIKHLQWTEKAYFGTSSEGGRMQKQLCGLRQALGLRIECIKEEGVRFPEYVVRMP